MYLCDQLVSRPRPCVGITVSLYRELWLFVLGGRRLGVDVIYHPQRSSVSVTFGVSEFRLGGNGNLAGALGASFCHFESWSCERRPCLVQRVMDVCRGALRGRWSRGLSWIVLLLDDGALDNTLFLRIGLRCRLLLLLMSGGVMGACLFVTSVEIVVNGLVVVVVVAAGRSLEEEKTLKTESLSTMGSVRGVKVTNRSFDRRGRLVSCRSLLTAVAVAVVSTAVVVVVVMMAAGDDVCVPSLSRVRFHRCLRMLSSCESLVVGAVRRLLLLLLLLLRGAVEVCLCERCCRC